MHQILAFVKAHVNVTMLQKAGAVMPNVPLKACILMSAERQCTVLLLSALHYTLSSGTVTPETGLLWQCNLVHGSLFLN